MAKNDEPQVFDLANPSRKIFVAVGGLTFLVLFLIAFSLALAVKFLEPSFQPVAIVLLIAIPLSGLAAATWLIFRSLNKFSRNSKFEVWELMTPEAQKRKLNGKVKTLAASLANSGERISDLQTAYLVAEDLAIRQIEREKKVSLTRRVRVGETDFDAVFLNRNAFTFVEILFLIAPDFSARQVDDYLKKTQLAKRKFVRLGLGAKIKLLLAIVTQMNADDEAKLRAALTDSFNSTPVDIDIRLLDFETLQRNFVEE